MPLYAYQVFDTWLNRNNRGRTRERLCAQDKSPLHSLQASLHFTHYRQVSTQPSETRKLPKSWKFKFKIRDMIGEFRLSVVLLQEGDARWDKSFKMSVDMEHEPLPHRVMKTWLIVFVGDVLEFTNNQFLFVTADSSSTDSMVVERLADIHEAMQFYVEDFGEELGTGVHPVLHTCQVFEQRPMWKMKRKLRIHDWPLQNMTSAQEIFSTRNCRKAAGTYATSHRNAAIKDSCVSLRTVCCEDKATSRSKTVYPCSDSAIVMSSTVQHDLPYVHTLAIAATKQLGITIYLEKATVQMDSVDGKTCLVSATFMMRMWCMESKLEASKQASIITVAYHRFLETDRTLKPAIFDVSDIQCLSDISENQWLFKPQLQGCEARQNIAGELNSNKHMSWTQEQLRRNIADNFHDKTTEAVSEQLTQQVLEDFVERMLALVIEEHAHFVGLNAEDENANKSSAQNHTITGDTTIDAYQEVTKTHEHDHHSLASCWLLVPDDVRRTVDNQKAGIIMQPSHILVAFLRLQQQWRLKLEFGYGSTPRPPDHCNKLLHLELGDKLILKGGSIVTLLQLYFREKKKNKGDSSQEETAKQDTLVTLGHLEDQNAITNKIMMTQRQPEDVAARIRREKNTRCEEKVRIGKKKLTNHKKTKSHTELRRSRCLCSSTKPY